MKSKNPIIIDISLFEAEELNKILNVAKELKIGIVHYTFGQQFLLDVERGTKDADAFIELTGVNLF